MKIYCHCELTSAKRVPFLQNENVMSETEFYVSDNVIESVTKNVNNSCAKSVT